MQDFLRMIPGQWPTASPNPSLLIREGCLVVLLLGLDFLLPLNFSADALDYYVSKTSKSNLSLYSPYYAEASNEFAVPNCPFPRHNAKANHDII